MKSLLVAVSFLLLTPASLFAQTEQDDSMHSEQQAIEFMGDRYVIHVDALHPDPDMTLMDVLLTCPELLSDNGKHLSQLYELRIDNIMQIMDDETVLMALKASEVSTVQVCSYTSVSKGGDGSGGIIDVYLKSQPDGATNGKLLLEGSTRGNGKVYTDIVSRGHNVTVRGYALTNLEYARGPLTDIGRYSSRQGIENIHLAIDWDISERDNLLVKLHQNFIDSKHRFRDGDISICLPELQRDWYGVASYKRILNQQEGTLNAEGGLEYLSTTTDNSQHGCMAYYFTELNMPLLNKDLNVMAGWEIDYVNTWTKHADRQQVMYNDFYAQFDYAKGPWVFTAGDRLRLINYWHRVYDVADSPLWHYHRSENSYLLSAGYKTDRHFLQGVYSYDYFVPGIYDFYSDDDDSQELKIYNTNYLTSLFWRAELRYAYQRNDIVVNGSVLHSWSDDNLTTRQRHTGVMASVTWRKGPLRLTAGADYYHGNVDGSHYYGRHHDNYFNLRLIPILVLPHGLRLSSMLLYNSRRQLPSETRPHLYASVKVSKQLSRNVTVSADFHDLAGTPLIQSYLVGGSYDNRALTVALAYRF